MPLWHKKGCVISSSSWLSDEWWCQVRSPSRPRPWSVSISEVQPLVACQLWPMRSILFSLSPLCLSPLSLFPCQTSLYIRAWLLLLLLPILIYFQYSLSLVHNKWVHESASQIVGFCLISSLFFQCGRVFCLGGVQSLYHVTNIQHIRHSLGLVFLVWILTLLGVNCLISVSRVIGHWSRSFANDGNCSLASSSVQIVIFGRWKLWDLSWPNRSFMVVQVHFHFPLKIFKSF